MFWEVTKQILFEGVIQEVLFCEDTEQIPFEGTIQEVLFCEGTKQLILGKVRVKNI